MLYRCPKGCIGESPFECVHGGSRAKAVEPDLDVDENVVGALCSAIRKAMGSPKSWNSPASRLFRERQDIINQQERDSKRGQDEGYRRLKAKAEYDTRLSNDLACCPCVPPPQAY